MNNTLSYPPCSAPAGRLLLVDDEEQLRFILGAHLKAAGFEALEASDGVGGD